LRRSEANSLLSQQLNFVAKNKNYLIEVLLTAGIEKFEKISDHKSIALADLQQQLRGPPKPKPRNVYKTDVL
jgi:exocyst complex component 8